MANKIKKQGQWKIDEKDSWSIVYKSLNPEEHAWDRDAWKTIGHYKKTHQSSKLSLLKGLVIEFGGRPLREILNVEPIDYQRKVQSKCVCGANLTDRLYRMRLKENSGKEGIEHHVSGKIKSGELVSQMGKASKTEFVVGKDCYAFLPEMLSELGYGSLREICDVKRSRNGKRKDLEDAINFPRGLHGEFESLGINPNIVRHIGRLTGKTGLTMHGLLYELDPGRKNSFANWFRERIKTGNIGDDEIVGIYEKLENAPYLVSKKELAKLATYSYEFRRFDANAVIGIEKDDLLYLNGLKEDDELLRAVGKPNIDKHYVRPATKFRSRNVIERITIRQKLEQSHITFLEALGVKLHFPKLEQIRKKANRKTSDKYGIGVEWNYLLKEIKPLFESEKSNLHEEYKKFGEIVKDHVLTKNEYYSVKDFLERGSLGSKTERENYLRMFSIGKFREIAPKITAIGRKLRMARKEYERSKNEWAWRDLIKQDYVLKEEFIEKSGQLGIANPERLIGMISEDNILGVKNKNLIKFQKEHGNMIRNMYENGLMASKYVSDLKNGSALSRYSKIMEKEKIQEMLDDSTFKQLENIRQHVGSGLISYVGQEPLMDASTKYISQKGITEIKELNSSLEYICKMSGMDISKKDEILREREELKKIGNVLYLDKSDWNFVGYTDIAMQEDKWTSKNFSFYRPDYVKMNLENMKNAVEVGKELIDDLKEIDKKHEVLGLPGSYINQIESRANGKKIYASKALKYSVERINDLYSK